MFLVNMLIQVSWHFITKPTCAKFWLLFDVVYSFCAFLYMIIQKGFSNSKKLVSAKFTFLTCEFFWSPEVSESELASSILQVAGNLLFPFLFHHGPLDALFIYLINFLIIYLFIYLFIFRCFRCKMDFLVNFWKQMWHSRSWEGLMSTSISVIPESELEESSILGLFLD